jgi:ureidoacrylate peracid hydrolase
LSAPSEGERPSLLDVIVPGETALIVIDMQRAFCDPDGGQAKAGRDVGPQTAAVPVVRDVVRAVRPLGIPVIWVLQEHLGTEDRTGAARRIPSHVKKQRVPVAESWAVRNTRDAELVDLLQPEVRPGDHIVHKHRMSCFYSTTLDAVLRILQVRTLIVTGVVTYVCVESTVRDAYYRDLDVVVVSDGVGGSDAAFHDDTLRKIDRYFGMVVDSRTLIGGLGQVAVEAPRAAGAPEPWPSPA